MITHNLRSEDAKTHLVVPQVQCAQLRKAADVLRELLQVVEAAMQEKRGSARSVG